MFIFSDADFAWDDAVETLPERLPEPRRVRRRRPPARTLASDLARLRAALTRRGFPESVPLSALALLVTLLALLAVAGVIRIALSNDAPPERAVPPSRSTPAGGRPASPPARQAPVARTLEPGDRGKAVLDLQAALGAVGVYAQAPDGVYGPATGSAVVAFQSDRGLVADGVAGPATAESLAAAIAEEAPADAEEAERGLAAAVAAGRVPEAAAARYRSILANSLAELSGLPPGRGATLALVLNDIAAHAADYDGPRALVLFTMLETNAVHLRDHALPAGSEDITDADGVLYRYFPAHGFQFHPLANFVRLNGLARQARGPEARRLAVALTARGIRAGGSLSWEYYFPFQGPPRWTSGFAQAVAAQALARSGALVEAPKLSEQAKAAFRAIPAGLSKELAGGLWIREYSFGDLSILNAQLQSIISLSEYVEISDDAEASAVVASMSSAAQALLPRFDTGCWSRYAFEGPAASASYHTYHVSLLRRLGAKTGLPVWRDTATRWAGFLAAGPC